MITIRKVGKKKRPEVPRESLSERLLKIRLAMNDLPLDLKVLVTNCWQGEFLVVRMNPIDIVKLDNTLSQNDPLYDNDECTYDGKSEVSMMDYIKIKYGAEVLSTLEKVLEV